MRYITQIDEEKFEVEWRDNSFFVNNRKPNFNIEKKGDYFLIQTPNKIYQAKIINREEDKVTLRLDNKCIVVAVKDENYVLLEKLNLTSKTATQTDKLQAPMPGTILKLNVKTGQKVKKGEGLLVLEAMKMENALQSPIDGIVDKIAVKEGQNVEKNDTLLFFS